MSTTSKQNRAIRSARKALRHAIKRDASEYIVGRIRTHIAAVKDGGRCEPNYYRQGERRRFADMNAAE